MCCFRPRGCAAHTNVRGDETLRLCSVCTVTHGMRLQRGFSDCGNFSGDFSLVAPCCCLLTLVYPTMYSRLWHKIWNLAADPCYFSLHKKNNWWHVSRQSWVPSRRVLVTVAMTSIYLFAKCRQRLHSGGTMTQQEVEATWAPENSSSGRNAWTWRACATKDGTSTIKTVWARSCQVRLSTPLFQQTWQTP